MNKRGFERAAGRSFLDLVAGKRELYRINRIAKFALLAAVIAVPTKYLI